MVRRTRSRTRTPARIVNGEPIRIAQWVRIRWWNACAYYAVTLAEALRRRGDESFLIAPSGTPAYREAAERGIATPDLGDPGSSNPLVAVASWRRVAAFLRQESIDVLNVHSGPGHLPLALLASRGGITVVRTRGDIRAPKVGPVQRALYRRAAHHLVSADCLRPPYAGLGVPPERLSTLRGAADEVGLAKIDRADARISIRRELGLGEDALLIGMIARLSPVKGHRLLLEALTRLPETVHAVFAGGDAQLRRADLEAEARAAGIGARVRFVGAVPDPWRWAAALDVAVIASIDSEAICRSAFEYMGLGLPIVASTVHAIGEVVLEGVGLRVPPGDAGALARATGELVASPELRARMGDSARNHFERHYTMERFGTDASALFRAVRERDKEEKWNAQT